MMTWMVQEIHDTSACGGGPVLQHIALLCGRRCGPAIFPAAGGMSSSREPETNLEGRWDRERLLGRVRPALTVLDQSFGLRFIGWLGRKSCSSLEADGAGGPGAVSGEERRAGAVCRAA